MSLQWQLPREIPADTLQIGQAVLREENVYRQIGERFHAIFPEESVFAPMYKSTGRGAIPPLLAGLVTVFQMLEKVPDRLAAQYVATRLDWKYALHLPLTYPGFHFSDLCTFRQRLLKYKRERALFEGLLRRLKELGLIKRRGTIRTDSTHVLGVVEHLSQLELVAESVRVALRATTELAPEWVGQQVPDAFREAYQERLSEYGLSEREVQVKLGQAGRDGFWLLAQIEQSAPKRVRELTAVETLRKVLAQQFPQGPGGPPASKRPAGGEVIESPHETEARRAVKRGKGWTGYKVQVSETCDAEQPRLLVDVEPTVAPAHDNPELPKIQARLQDRDVLPAEQHVDQGYISAERIADSHKLGIDLVGPCGDLPGPEGFRQSDFQFDAAAQQAICPAGQVSTVWSERPAPEGGPAAIQIRFDGPTCQACSFFGRCTRSTQGRSLGLHPYRKLLQERRAEAQTDTYRQKLHLRAGIEATISELVRGHRLRFARYRGLAKLRLHCLFTAVAVNLKRLARWWTRPQAQAA